MSSQHKSKPVLADDTPMVTDGTPMVTGDTPVVTDGAPTVTGDRTHLVADGTPVVASDTPPMAGGTSLVADGTPVVADGTPILADADLATALYNKGIYTNQNFEGLNLSQPQLVRSTLHEFKKAGAQILHTNTLAASRTHLQAFDLQHKQSQIIDAACQLALDVAQNTDAAQNEAAAQNTGTAQNEIFVAGAVRLQALTPSEALEASKTNHPSPNLPPALQDFNQQVETLLKHPLQALALWTPPCWLTLEAGLQELQRLML